MGIEGAAQLTPLHYLNPPEKKVWLRHRVQEIRKCPHPVPGYRGWNGKLLGRGGWVPELPGWWLGWWLRLLLAVGVGKARGVALLTNDSNLERCQRYANLLPEM